jgi:hypothetical protein
MPEIKDDYEALVMALTLALTAPSEPKFKQCVVMAEAIANRLTPEQVEEAKAKAIKSMVS